MSILNSYEMFILELFNLDHHDVDKISYHNIAGNAYVDVKLSSHPCPCPECGYESPFIKGYVLKKIKHSALTDRSCILNYHARRYACPICHRTFYEKNPFVFKAQKISTLTVFNVLHDLKDFNETFSSVAKRYDISPTSVASIFDSHVDISRKPLPTHLNFDEVYAFRSQNSKYVCVLLDYIKQTPIDLLPSRHKDHLIDYFHLIPYEERQKVQFVCFDMWDTYRDVSKLMFPNCLTCVDRFHIMQDIGRKLDSVRKRVMKGFNDKRSDGYYLLKKFNWLLFKTDSDLFSPDNEKKFNYHFKTYLNYYDLSIMLRDLHPDLAASWKLKDEVIDLYENYTYENVQPQLYALIRKFLHSDIDEMVAIGNTLLEWKVEIINSFILVKDSYKIDKDTGEINYKPLRMNNGIIENRNKIIKCIKHNANGYTNWHRYRNRLLYVLDKNATFKLNPIEVKHDSL